MVNKSLLAKKLASYSTLATLVLAVNHESDAQIIYTNLNPAVTINPPAGNYLLDLNNDGIPDYNFSEIVRTFIAKSYVASVLCVDNNEVDADTADVYGSLISSKINWKFNGALASGALESGSNSTHRYSTYFAGGAFFNEQDKFLPLKLLKNGATCYGWVRLSLTDAKSVAIIDYAYNSIPDSSIIAGNEGCKQTPVTPVISVAGDTLKSSSAIKYRWYLSGLLLQGDTTNVITANLGNSYSVITTDTNGCISQSQSYYYDSCFAAKPYVGFLASTYEYNGPDTASCYPVTSLQEFNLPLHCTIQWLLNGKDIPGATNSTYSPDSVGDYSALFINSANKGCSETSNSVHVNVYPKVGSLPIVSQVCDTLFTPTSSNHIQWYDEVTDSLYNDTTTKFIPPSSGSFGVIYTNSYGCQTNGGYAVYSPFTETGFGPCSSMGNYIVCSDAIDTLSPCGGFYYYDTAYISYQWQKDSMDIIGAKKSYYYVDTSGYYSVIVISGSCTMTSTHVYVSEDTKNPTIEKTGLKLYTQYFVFYQWYRNDTIIIGETGQYYQPTESGNYYVVVTDDKSCTFQSPNYYYTYTGLGELNSPAIFITKNNNLLTIKFSGEPYFGYRLSIYNTLGQKVYDLPAYSVNMIVDLSSLTKGLYLVTLEKEDKRVVKKIILN